MPMPPALNIKTRTNYSPHVVILGAGASLAALPNGDRYGKKLPVMSNLIEILELKHVIARYEQEYKEENFESWYDRLVSSGDCPELCEKLEEIIGEYFEYMQLPDEPTIYDYLILSLRNKDIIATFNWDPLLSQAFSRNKDAIGYENLPKIVYLHGNVAIGVCYGCKSNGWRYNQCIQCGNRFSPSKLLFPVSKKDYNTDGFIFGEWSELEKFINHAYFLTIFGYSAPTTDLEARKLMLNAWRQNASEYHTMISIVDIKSNDEISTNWQDFIVADDYMISNNFFDDYLARHPRRSCEAWAMATLQQEPWKENNFPIDISLIQLQDWTRQLVDEEKSGLDNRIYTIK